MALSGLEDTVEFWKQVFTRFSSKEVVFFDPLDPGKIYRVIRAPETDAGRAMIDQERARVLTDYDLNEEDGRVRSQRGARDQFLSGLKVSGRYLPAMQRIFREAGLPVELAYLPLVESSFNIKARSSVGAVGMWQFMPDTGKKFLRISDSVDERRDPLASTRAAARLLKENYQILGQWPLAITAYNHGTEGIFRAIHTVGSRNLVDLIRRYQAPTFGFASKNFYAEFLAAIEIASNRNDHFPYLRTDQPLDLHEVEVKRQFAVQSLLGPARISRDDFFEWNPALNPGSKNFPLGYRVKLPADKVNGFMAVQRRSVEAQVAKKTVARPTKARTAALPIGRTRRVAAKGSVKGRPAPQVSARTESEMAAIRKIAAEPRLKKPKS